jgi:FAD/FMN-containing dehydrogenase
MALIHDPALHALRHELRGHVYDPGEPEYDEACTLFNAMIERRPRHVVRCSRPHHVAAALDYARRRDLRVAVRAGGHSVAGLSLVDDGIVIDVRGFDEIVVDPDRRVVRAGAGLTWARLDAATQAHGLATTGGRVSSTGVAGLTLGGGSGWLERKHGLACDNVLAVELVTAQGVHVRATADEHPELFWALRGGGGNFGVVTAIEFALHPVGPEVLGGLLLHPAERGRELLRLFRDVMNDAPPELSLAFVYLTAPDDEDIPPELRGRPAVAIAGMHCGALEDAEQALAPIRAYGPPALDAFGPVPYADFQCSIDDPPGYRNWWTAEYLEDLSDDAIEAIAGLAAQHPAGPAQIFIAAWGGAVAAVSEDATPLAKRDARFVVHPLLLWDDPAQDEPMRAYGRAYRDALAPYRTGGVYLNFVGEEGGDRVRAAFGPNHERLARVKAGWDPDNVFRATGNVRAAEWGQPHPAKSSFL